MSYQISVLLVEDSDDDALLVLHELRQSGFDPICERVDTPEGMCAALERGPWDVIISDHAMPRFNAPMALSLVKEKKLDLPFIIVSGYISEEAAVAAMRAGAHDYLSKDKLARLGPAVMRELREAAVRRAHRQSIEQVQLSEQRFRLLVEQSPLGTQIFAPDGALVQANRAWEKLWHTTLAAVQPYNILRDERLAAKGILPSLQRAFAGEPMSLPPVRFTLEPRRGQKCELWLRLFVYPVKYPDQSLCEVVVVHEDITERVRAEEVLRRSHEELERLVRERTADLVAANVKLQSEMNERRRLEQEILEITEKERRRIGLELHADLGQQLTGVSLMLKGLEQKLARKRAREAAEARQLQTLVHGLMNQTRDARQQFNALNCAGDQLPVCLRQLAAQARELLQISCRVTLNGRNGPLDENVVAQLYKITQEAIANGVKHGQSKRVVIALSRQARRLVLAVSSDGLPFPAMPAQSIGTGLRIMHYRASVIGATLEVRANNNGGTRVTCTLPLPARRQTSPA